MNGIVLVDKPKDFTSFDVVAKMRGILKTKKIGHAGTLDPMATGVLPLFIGRATKCCDILPNQDKSYIAEFKLGITTDTQDITGKVLEERAVNITKEQFYETVNSFKGEIQQLPPMYSAVKVNGKKLYELARKGIEVERKTRKINIYDIEILDEDFSNNIFKIKADCSKGTYIRTLCNDIGEKLGCGGTLTELRRVSAGGFDIENCYTITQIQNMISCEDKSFIIPIRNAFVSLKKVNLTQKQTKMFLNGVKLYVKNIDISSDYKETIGVYSNDDKFLGTAYIDLENNCLRIGKLFELEV